MQDLRYGIRVLLKSPGFTLIAVATLALGIGANTAMFSVINAVLLKPFSFRNPEQLVVLWERCVKEGLPRMVVSPPNFADWRNQNNVFQDVAAYRLQDFTVGCGKHRQPRRNLHSVCFFPYVFGFWINPGAASLTN